MNAKKNVNANLPDLIAEFLNNRFTKTHSAKPKKKNHIKIGHTEINPSKKS